MPVARLEAKLTGNDVEFNNALDRAEKRAATFTGRVESQFQGLFKRTPGRRAERAIGGLLGDIATGNASMGIAQFAGKITGLGLAVGVGIGASVELFNKLHDSVVEVRKAHDELDRQMAKPLALTSIDGLSKAIDALQEKQNTFTHSVTSYLSDIFQKPLVEGTTGIFDLGKTQIDEEAERTKSIAKKQAAERLRGQTELSRANVLGTVSDPLEKGLIEQRFKFEDRRRELMASPDKGSAERLKALDAEEAAAEKNYNLARKASELKLSTEEKIQGLIQKGLKPEDQKKVRTALELKNLDDEISGETDPHKLRALKLERSTKENELRGMAGPQEGGNPFTSGTISARDFERQQDTAKFNENFASFGLTQQQKDTKGPAAPNAEVEKAINTTNELLKQIFLK